MPKVTKENGPSGLRAKTNDLFRETAKKEPLWYYKTSGNAFGRPGVPDYLGTYDGVSFAIELKSPGEEPTAKQYDEMSKLSRAGATVTVCWTMDDVKSFMDKVRGIARQRRVDNPVDQRREVSDHSDFTRAMDTGTARPDGWRGS